MWRQRERTRRVLVVCRLNAQFYDSPLQIMNELLASYDFGGVKSVKC